MNWRAVRAIVRKDLKVVLKSRAVLIPLIMVPLIILVILPAVGGVLLANANPDSPEIADFRRESAMFFDNLPGTIGDKLDQYDNEVQRVTYVIFNLFFPSMYLLLPTMVANVIAADSFAGEKERKTLESLIYTPTTDRELLLAKVLGALIPGAMVGLGGFVVYTIVANLVALNVVGMLILPNTLWLLLAFFVGPAAAAFGLGVTVIASSRVNSFQEAYQIGSLVVLPIVLLVVGQAMGAFLLSNWLVLLLGIVLWAADAVVFFIASASFRRTALMARI
ncbi:MAG: ABC transporter permease subunit [Caldilineaceae bacterium]|nr:ABC transporter permease subunit [Caldilineaceae bacterium]